MNANKHDGRDIPNCSGKHQSSSLSLTLASQAAIPRTGKQNRQEHSDATRAQEECQIRLLNNVLHEAALRAMTGLEQEPYQLRHWLLKQTHDSAKPRARNNDKRRQAWKSPPATFIFSH